MNTREYKIAIVNALQLGKDWEGVSRVHMLYELASGQERNRIIEAMEQIINSHEQEPAVIANLVDIAFDLDISQLDQEIEKLKETNLYSNEYVNRAVNNYLAFKKLQRNKYLAVLAS